MKFCLSLVKNRTLLNHVTEDILLFCLFSSEYYIYALQYFLLYWSLVYRRLGDIVFLSFVVSYATLSLYNYFIEKSLLY